MSNLKEKHAPDKKFDPNTLCLWLQMGQFRLRGSNRIKKEINYSSLIPDAISVVLFPYV